MKIMHLADIHIINDPQKHKKYRTIFDKLYTKIKQIKPDRIVLVGDTLDNFINTSLEAETLASELLNNLSSICKTIVSIGNHEIRKRDIKRVSSIGTIIKMMNNNNIILFDKSGFYEDDDIVWVNYSHLEKKIIPWKDIKHTKEKDKTYIGLFHDPVYGCKLPNGMKMESNRMPKIANFNKNDINMFGDIHLRQFINKKSAYSGSLEGHGGLLWEIDKDKTFTHKDIDIPNEHTLITFDIKEGFDYDSIKFNHSLATDKSSFRVIWEDISPNINLENEEKLKKYIRNKWKNDNPIKWKKIRIFQNIASSQKLTESLNVNDTRIQQEIFKEYLENNKYDKEFIEDILEIDDIINERLELTDTISNTQWNIDKFWIDNFKSYDKEEIDWEDINGIIQLSGKNKQGKTSLLDAICYIAYGTTLSTNKLGGAKREKNGDNRYINNKRKLDYCNGGAILDINGEKFTILRKTNREWTKGKKSIKSCSTIIDYYKGIEISEDNKLVDENKIKTQQMIDQVLGEFEDFIRLSLTNADNLNALISLDRATFMDSIIKDAGFDIFEKKLDEYKIYKKEEDSDKISINLDDANIELDGLKQLIETLKIDKNIINKSIEEVIKKIDSTNKERDKEIKKINKIDDDIAKIDVNDINKKLDDYKIAIDNNLLQQKTNTNKTIGLQQTYDKNGLDELYSKTKTIEDDILNHKLTKSQLESTIQTENNTIDRVHDKVRELKNKENSKLEINIKDKEREITKLNDIFNNIVNEQIREFNDKIRDTQYESKTIDTNLINIKEKGIVIKKRINELENSKVCPECDRELEKDALIHIGKKINTLKDDINNLMTNVKELQLSKSLLEQEIIDISSVVSQIEIGKYNDELINKEVEKYENIKHRNEEIDGLKTIIDEIKIDNFKNAPTLKSNIDKGLKIKIQCETNIKDNKDTIIELKETINTCKENKLQYSDDILLLERSKEEVKTYETLIQENKELSLKIENIKLIIENAKSKVDRYYKQLKYIDENIETDLNISLLDNIIIVLKEENDEENDRLNEAIQEIGVTNNTIDDMDNRIEKFKAQAKRDELLKVYMSCVHRDGIPTMLILKSKELINKEISDLLCDCDFEVFFDEELNLKLVANISPGIEQNLLESSGAERTFGAIALKLALREINHKSKGSFMFLDEIYGKLIDESIDDFNELLLQATKKIDKIIIIEHHANVPYDSLFSVSKDSKGISKLTTE